MDWVLQIYGVASFLILPQITSSAEVMTFKGSSYPEILNCGQVRLLDNIDCICVTGLWRLYGDCSNYYSIAGISHCLHAPKIYSEKQKLLDVTHALEILPNKGILALVRNSSQVIKIPTRISERRTSRILLKNDVLVTGSPHTIVGSLGSICMFPQEGAYCTYKPQEFIGHKIDSVQMGCKEDEPYISPVSCIFEKGPQSCHEALIADRFEESLDNNILDETGETSKRREKRQAWNSGRFTRAQPSYGRTFLGLAGQEKAVERGVEELMNEDEDYMSAAEKGNITESSTETILSEIWNYIDMQSEVVMGLRKSRGEAIDYGIPYFKLLHLSKKVMQKVCPAEYVSPGFFEIAVQTFIQVQVKRFIWEEPNANLPGFSRIKIALTKCAEDKMMYPFLLPSMGGNLSCDPNATLGGQLQIIYNASLELNVTDEFVGLDRDPIIETVWKIFFSTTSFCFPYFKETGVSFNDHHRYISWISSLFNNGIHDIWMQSNATNFTYDQFLGDMTVIMEKVAYCAAASRNEDIDMPYPWELRRVGNFTTDAADPAAGRKKRSSDDKVVSVTATKCMSPGETKKCFSNTKPHESFFASARRKRKTYIRTIPAFHTEANPTLEAILLHNA